VSGAILCSVCIALSLNTGTPIWQVIAIKFEMEFEDYSYGFRPNRNARQAVLKAQEYINSGYAARKIENGIYLFLKDKLKLPINREKSGIRKPVNFTILGYGFVHTYVKGERGK